VLTNSRTGAPFLTATSVSTYTEKRRGNGKNGMNESTKYHYEENMNRNKNVYIPGSWWVQGRDQ